MNTENSSSDTGESKETTGKAPVPSSPSDPPVTTGKRSHLKTVMLSFLVLILVLLGGGIGWYWYHFHGNPFSPVELTQGEQKTIDQKLELAGGDAVFDGTDTQEPAEKPIVIQEEDRRTIIITEREINGVLHHNTDLAEKLYIDLKRDAVVAKMIHLFDEETPLFGGKTLRLNITMNMFLDDQGKLQLSLDDVTVGGIPLPNAWLLDMKDKNLIELDSSPEGTGLLQRIADGIDDFKVEKGQIRIRLSE